MTDGKKWYQFYAENNLYAAALSDFEKDEKRTTTYVLSDSTVHKALIKLDAWLTTNSEVASKESIKKILGDEARQIIRGHKQRISLKATNGKALDVTAYPFDKTWTGADAKILALVRSFGCSSPYSQIADGHDFKKDQQILRVIFRLERSIESAQEEDNAKDAVIDLLAE